MFEQRFLHDPARNVVSRFGKHFPFEIHTAGPFGIESAIQVKRACNALDDASELGCIYGFALLPIWPAHM